MEAGGGRWRLGRGETIEAGGWGIWRLGKSGVYGGWGRVGRMEAGEG